MRVTVTTSLGGEVLEHFEKLAAVVVRARDLLAVNPAAPFGAQLLKLCVERLSVGAHTGIAETPVFAGWFGLGADSGGSRPRIRDDVAHHSDLISLGVPR
jgi:hypothetical protein